MVWRWVEKALIRTTEFYTRVTTRDIGKIQSPLDNLVNRCVLKHSEL